MTYRPIGPVEGHAARQPVLIVFEDLRPTKSEKFSDLASGVHAALGGPPQWRLEGDHFASVIDELHFTGHQPLRPVQMALTAFSAQARCSASPEGVQLAEALHIPRVTGW